MLARLRAYLLAGIVVTTPLAITFWLTWNFIRWVDVQVTPLIPAAYNPGTYLPFSVPGLGLLIMLIFLTLVGFVAANFFGRSLIHLGERLVGRMPVVRSIYGAAKQIIETVLRNSSNSFRQVVLMEYPRRGVWSIAFLTGEASGELQRRLGEDWITVYMPTTPNPTSGFLLMVRQAEVIALDMSVEDAIKLIISAGVIVPPDHAAANVEAPELPFLLGRSAE
jgi:uncharacterized membrane protein